MASYLRWLWVLLVFAWLAGAAGCGTWLNPSPWQLREEQAAVKAKLAGKSDLEVLVIAKDKSDRSRFGRELRRQALSRLDSRGVCEPNRPEAEGKAIVEGLVDELSSWRELGVGDSLFMVLRDCHEYAYMIVPVLVEIWHREGGKLRSSFFFTSYMITIGELANSDTPEALSVFEAQLPVGRTGTRGAALVGLGNMGAAARSAVPMVESMLTHPDEWIRARAAHALWRITGEVERPLRVAIELVDSYGRGRSQYHQDLPFQIIVAMGADGRPAVPLLRKMVRREDGYCPHRFKSGPEDCQNRAAHALRQVEQSQ